MKSKNYKLKIFLGIKIILLALVIFSCGGAIETITPELSQTNQETSQQTLTVGNLKLVETAFDSATVSWLPQFNSDGLVDDNVAYRVSALLNGEEVVSQEVTSLASNMLYSEKISGLTSAVPYQIVVQAKTLTGKTTGQSSIWVIPSDVSMSTSSKTEEMLVEVMEISNTSISNVEVTWKKNNVTPVYVIIATEDNTETAGALTEVKSEKITEIACIEEISDLGCKAIKFDPSGNIKNEIAGLKAGIDYTIMVIPVTFRDLAGLRATDLEGNPITAVNGVKELIEDKNSLINYQAQKVLEEILKGTLSVVSKTKVISILADEIPAPMNLTAITYINEIHVSWDLVSGATDYVAVLSKIDDSINLTNNINRSDASLLSGGNTVFYGTVEGNYTVTVTPFSGSKRGESAGIKITVNADVEEFSSPNQITDLNVDNNAIDEMTLSWVTSENDSLTGYHIYYYKTNTAAPRRPNYTADKGETNLIIKNISPGIYTIRVDAVADGVIVKGIDVNGIVYTIPKPVESLSASMTISDSVNGSADVQWMSPQAGSPAEEFVVEYLKGVSTELTISNNSDAVMGLDWSGALNISVPVESGSNTYTITVAGLNTKTAANVFRVKSVNRSGESEYGYHVLGANATSSPSVVENITSSSHETNGFTVTWESPTNGGSDTDANAMEVSGYKVSWRKNGTGDYQSSDVLSESTLSYAINGLEMGAQYEVLIQAKNDANGEENFNAGEMRNTWTSSYPGEVTDITYSDWSMAGFTVSWNAPIDFGKKDDGSGDDYPAVSYTVRVYDAVTNEFKVYEDITGTSQVITDVDSGKKYFVTLVAKNDIGLGTVAEKEYTWLPSAPQQVVDLVATNYTASGFTLKWSAPSDLGKKNDGSGDDEIITGYKVMISNDDGINLGTETVSTTSKTFTGLEAGAAYHVRVLAVNANGDGVVNPAMRVWTGSLPGNIGVITTDSGTTNITVAWLEVSPGKQGITDGGVGEGRDNLTSYKVEYKEDLENAEYREFANVSETNVNITGLTGGTGYRVKITALNEYGSSAPVESDLIATVSMAVKPGVPGEIIANEVTANTVALSWTAPVNTGLTPQGNVAVLTGYVLEYSNTTGEWLQLAVGTEGIRLQSDIELKTNATVEGLTGGTSYGFRVSAINRSFAGDSSAVKIAETKSLEKKPGITGEINANNVTATNLVLSWSEPGDTGLKPDGTAASITGYVLEYSNAAGEWLQLAVGTEGIRLQSDIELKTNATVEGLTGGTSYGFRVSAMNATGIGSSTDVKAVETISLAREPGVPGEVTVDGITTTTIALSWMSPTNTGLNPDGSVADLIGYVLEYSNESGEWLNISTSGSGVRLSSAIGINTSTTVEGLVEDTVYKFRLAANNAVGVGSATEVVTTKTLNPYLALSVSLSPSSFNLNLTENAVVSYTFYPSTATNTNIIWSSSAADVVTVLENGEGTANITAVGGGKISLWAVAGNISNSVEVTVLAPPNNFRQTSCNKSTEIDLAWDTFPGMSYEIYRVNNDGTKSLIASPTVSSHTVSGLNANTYYLYEIKTCAGGQCSDSVSLLALTSPSVLGNDLNAVITAGQIPADLSAYDELAQDIFQGYAAGTPIVSRYVVAGGSGDKSGTSWLNASDNLRTLLNGISDASSAKVYAVLLGPGVYKAGSEMMMKNNITIGGGISPCNTVPVNAAANIAGPTTLNGEDSYRVFNNNNINNSARLYGVTITKGHGGASSGGGGMYNNASSPVLTKVIFLENTAGSSAGSTGGAMYNNTSSPVLTDVVFSGNEANNTGGGMYNGYNSSAVLTGVIFTNNSANGGGGMFNSQSSPVLTNVTFSRNTAANSGGGMYNNSSSSPFLSKVLFLGNKSTGSYGSGGGMISENSSPVLSEVVFTDNTAYEGAGMYSSHKSFPVLTDIVFSGNRGSYGAGMGVLYSFPILNRVIFSNNTASIKGGGLFNRSSSPILIGTVFSKNSAASGSAIYNETTRVGYGSVPTAVNTIFWENNINNLSGSSASVYYSVVEGGTADSVNNIITTNPKLEPLINNGGWIDTMAISADSPAVNKGLYVKRSATKTGTIGIIGTDYSTYAFYYSIDNSTWYNTPELDNDGATAITLPADAVDLTAVDMTGYQLQSADGRPDIGVYEVR